MEGGWDRLCDCGRTLGERDGNNEPLAEDDEDNDNKYGKDGDIPNDDDEYTIGVDGVGKPLEEAMTSFAPARACPASQRLSMPSR